MDSLEYEALRRAQEMQNQSHNQRSRPKGNLAGSHKPGNTENKSQPENHREASYPQAPVCENASEPVSSVPSTGLPILFEDKEKLLILVLVMILCSEDSTDPALILALLYIII